MNQSLKTGKPKRAFRLSHIYNNHLEAIAKAYGFDPHPPEGTLAEKSLEPLSQAIEGYIRVMLAPSLRNTAMTEAELLRRFMLEEHMLDAIENHAKYTKSNFVIGMSEDTFHSNLTNALGEAWLESAGSMQLSDGSLGRA